MMREEMHSGMPLLWFLAVKVRRSLDSVGTNRYRRDPENHAQR